MAKKKESKPYAMYSEKTQKFMSAIHEFLISKFGEIEIQWYGILDMLATQYEIFTQCRDNIRENGLITQNRFGVPDKNPLLKQMTDCQIQIVKLINEFGLSPRSVSKLNLTPNDEDNFINDLIQA